jgi:hypothetical protein
MPTVLEDTGIYALRVALALLWAALFFLAGTIYQQSQPVKVPYCVEAPPKQTQHYPRTKKEMAQFIQYYSNRGM